MPGELVHFELRARDVERAAAGEKLPIPHVGSFAHCPDTEGNAFGLFRGDESITGDAWADSRSRSRSSPGWRGRCRWR
jgi:hypothetical protein